MFANWIFKILAALAFNHDRNLITWILRIVSYVNAYIPLEMFQFFTIVLYKNIEQVRETLE